jgi:hypothetical protein
MNNVIDVKPCGACTWLDGQRTADEAFVAALAGVAIFGPVPVASKMCPHHQEMLVRMVKNGRNTTTKDA